MCFRKDKTLCWSVVKRTFNKLSRHTILLQNVVYSYRLFRHFDIERGLCRLLRKDHDMYHMS